MVTLITGIWLQSWLCILHVLPLYKGEEPEEVRWGQLHHVRGTHAGSQPWGCRVELYGRGILHKWKKNCQCVVCPSIAWRDVHVYMPYLGSCLCGGHSAGLPCAIAPHVLSVQHLAKELRSHSRLMTAVSPSKSHHCHQVPSVVMVAVITYRLLLTVL